MSREDKIQKIGILGGTFDPVHKGHIAVARTVLDRYQLNRILFIPAFSPPHKDNQLTPFSHRVAMLENCLENMSHMSISMLEAERDAPSYTVETLHELHKRIGPCIFYLIVGADMFVEIELWYRYQKLFQLAHIIVAARPGVTLDGIIKQVDRLPGAFQYDRNQQVWSREDGRTISYCHDIEEYISSSDIRSRLAKGEAAEELLPEPVSKYIQKHGLYISPA